MIKIFVILLTISSCDDIFLRFQYENYDCKKNKYKISKIKITNYKIDSVVKVFINGSEINFKVMKNNPDKIIIQNHEKEVSIYITKKSDEVKGTYKNNIFSLNCIKSGFRI